MPVTESEGPLRRGITERLGRAMVVREQLESSTNDDEVRLNFEGMDLAFVTTGGRLVGLRLFGEREVVGLVVAQTPNLLTARLRRLGQTDEGGCLLSQGARVVGLTEADLGKWLAYYEVAEAYRPVLGMGAWEQSGLRRFKTEEIRGLERRLRELVGLSGNSSYLRSTGATGLVVIKGERGALFFGGGDKCEALVLRNVRVGSMKDGMLEEAVATRTVAGVVIPRFGESKADLYRRAEELGEMYGQKLGREVVFAAATAGQIKMWEGWGMAPEKIVPGLVSEDDVLRLLILGQSNLSPGLLCRFDGGDNGERTLLDRELMPGLLTFVGRTDVGGRGGIEQLSPVQVFDPRARRKGEFRTVPLNGAVAIMRVPDDMEFDSMKLSAKPLEDRYFHLMNVIGSGAAKPRLVFLTPLLMRHWQNGGFWATKEQVSKIEPTRKREYGFVASGRGGSEQPNGGIFYTASYSGPKIGGGCRGILDRSSANDALIVLDAGRQFGKENRPERVRYEEALITALRDGDLGMWADVLTPEALLYSARIVSQTLEQPGAETNPLCVFLATELAANLSREEVVGVLGEKVGEWVMRVGSEQRGLFGNPDARIIQILSHVHVDHTSLTQNLRPEILLLMSLASLVMAEARDDLNPVSAEILTAPEWWKARQGSPTPRQERSLQVMGDEVYMFGDSQIKLSPVEHSTIGAVGRRITFPGLVVADPGDFRRWGRYRSKGSATERMAEEWARGDLDWLIMEATGVRSGVERGVRRWREQLAKIPVITDEDITTGVAEILQVPESAGKTVVVYSSPYDLERNVAIMEAAVASGREVVLGVRHAMIASRYAMEQKNLDRPADRWGMDLPIGKYGLFLTEGAKKRSAVTALAVELKSKGVPIYDRENILSGQAGRVLFFNPFGNEISALALLPLVNKMQVIWSASRMFSRYDLSDFLKNKAGVFTQFTDTLWAEAGFWNGGRLPFKLRQPKFGVLHRSGHSSHLELLWFLSYFQDKKMGIVLHHTEEPVAAKKMIEEAFPKVMWRIVASLPHTDLRSLPSREKRWMGPLLRLDK